MSEWSKEADCKSVYRRFESCCALFSYVCLYQQVILSLQTIAYPLPRSFHLLIQQAMEKVYRRQLPCLSPELREAMLTTLIYKGRVAAIKLYKEHTSVRLTEAKELVEKLVQEIEPGPA